MTRNLNKDLNFKDNIYDKRSYTVKRMKESGIFGREDFFTYN